MNISAQKWDKWSSPSASLSSDSQGLDSNNVKNKNLIFCIYLWFKPLKLSHKVSSLPPPTSGLLVTGSCPPMCLCLHWWGGCHAVLILRCGKEPHACCFQPEYPAKVGRMVWVFWCPPRISQRWQIVFHCVMQLFEPVTPKQFQNCGQLLVVPSLSLLLHDPS